MLREHEQLFMALPLQHFPETLHNVLTDMLETRARLAKEWTAGTLLPEARAMQEKWKETYHHYHEMKTLLTTGIDVYERRMGVKQGEG